MTVNNRDPATGRFVRGAAIVERPSTNPRDVYGDEVLAAIYEDVRSWPEVKELDVSDPDQPRITFHAGLCPHYAGWLPPTTYQVDYRYAEDNTLHFSQHVIGVSAWAPYRQHCRGVNRHDRTGHLKGSYPVGGLCHGPHFRFDNQDPFGIFGQLRQWHLGMGHAYSNMSWAPGYHEWWQENKDKVFPLIVAPDMYSPRETARMVQYQPGWYGTGKWQEAIGYDAPARHR